MNIVEKYWWIGLLYAWKGIFLATAVTPLCDPQSMHGLSYGQPAPPAGSADPSVGANSVYHRISRQSPFNITVAVWNNECDEISYKPMVKRYINAALQDIYWWQPWQWNAELDRCCTQFPLSNRSEAINRKAGMFWEELALALSRRIFGHRSTSVEAGQHHLMLALALGYGPSCASLGARSDAEWLSCADNGISDAAQITVITSIDGARDPLNPTTRQINLTITRPFAVVPASYLINVAEGLHVASSYHEVVNLVPSWDGQSRNINLQIRGVAAEPSALQSNFNFPDYNLAFIPFRHLVLQGPVANPKVSHSSLHYTSEQALQSAASRLVEQLFDSNAMSKIVTELSSFFNAKYYYMFSDFNFSFNGSSGIDGYQKYILESQFGLAGGLATRYSDLKLEIVRQEQNSYQSRDHSSSILIGATCGLAAVGVGIFFLIRYRFIYTKPSQSVPTTDDDDFELLDWADQDVLEVESPKTAPSSADENESVE